MKTFDVSAQLAEKYGKIGSPERIANEEKAIAFFTGKMVEDARKQSHITQAELGKRIGADRSYISKVESGKIEPKVSTFYRIINAMGLRIDLSMPL